MCMKRLCVKKKKMIVVVTKFRNHYNKLLYKIKKIKAYYYQTTYVCA